MEKKIILEPVYKTERIQNGTKEKVIYIALNGEEFNDEKACQSYEKKLNTLKEGEFFVKTLDSSSNIQESVCRMMFGGYNISDVQCFKIHYTADEIIREKILNYLRAVGCDNVYESNVFSSSKVEGGEILICSWNEDENSDYPSSHTYGMTYKNASELMNTILNNFKSLLA